ncbi:MAG TPA: M20/M25/M40 family metallo-hydrolase, partial [Sphingomonas sp.]
MRRALSAILLTLIPSLAAAQHRPDQRAFFPLFKELVETDTTLSAGSCTKAAGQVAVRLKAAGFRDADITLFSVPEHPREGGMVAVLVGSDPRAKPMLLLGHLDVVEARRADWTRDPFKLVEEGGYLYARGTSDMKAMVAIWADTMIRLRSGPAPKRTIKMALTCGEESGARMNGAEWLTKNRSELIAAGFALNEGGGGGKDASGRIVAQNMQVGEKANRNFELTVTNPGGHSSVPRSDNAIYQLAAALTRVGAYTFPIRFNATTRAYFARSGAARPGPAGEAMARL